MSRPTPEVVALGLERSGRTVQEPIVPSDRPDWVSDQEWADFQEWEDWAAAINGLVIERNRA